MRALCPRPPLYGQVQSPDPTRYRIPVGIDMDFPPDVDLVSGIIRDIEKGAQS
jgi:hypothetical protein